jgi:S-adenosyl-L-methionine hydrolase (adenosine-forming)
MSRPIITLTTDFGLLDGYVGAMKGVLLSLCPEAQMVDISHEIRPQAVQQAAFVLSTVVPYFPPGTVHLVVVDPTVGSERRPLVIETGRAFYVAPDNGVLSLALQRDPARQAVHLTDARYRLAQVSATFHGRDIFAPAAAHLACGTNPGEMGDPIPLSELVTLPAMEPQPRRDGLLQGQILHIDRFGNLITNFRIPDTVSQITVMAAGRRIEKQSRTFADVEPGELLAYQGSSGYLEIAVREGNAARTLRLEIGDPVQVEGAR